MKASLIVLTLLIVTACAPRIEEIVQSVLPVQSDMVETSVPKPVQDVEKEMPLKKASLPMLGAAPELTTTVWLNTPSPLRLIELNGKVVLLEMWTYGVSIAVM